LRKSSAGEESENRKYQIFFHQIWIRKHDLKLNIKLGFF
jgi:hypothetical protein